MIVFISVLCLFYLNVFSDIQKSLFFYNFHKYIGLFLGFFSLFLIINYNYVLESSLMYQLFFFSFNDDYYEALFNNKLNDLFSLNSSYYLVNSLEYIFVGLLLLIGSLVCINFYRFKNNFKLSNYSNFLLLFDLFNDFVNSSFLRKQNLIDQNFINSAIKFFNKKTA